MKSNRNNISVLEWFAIAMAIAFPGIMIIQSHYYNTSPALILILAATLLAVFLFVRGNFFISVRSYLKENYNLLALRNRKSSAEKNVAASVVHSSGSFKDETGNRVSLLPNDGSNAENRYRLLIEYSTDVITIIDAHGIIMYQSPAIEKVTAFNSDELTGKNVFEFIHPEDTQRMSEALSGCITHEGVKSSMLTHRFRHKNGSWICIESQGTSRLNTQGINGIVINSRDITERLLAQKELEEKDEQLRTFFANTHEAFFSVDMIQNRLLQLSPANKNIYARSDEEFFNNINLWSDVIHPDDKYLVPGIFQNVAAGLPFSTEYRIIKGDGTFCWIENKITPTLDAEKRPVRIDGIVSDITARKKDEEKIKEQFRELQKTNYELDRFVYSVSHDLRAPLTSIKGIINVAELDEMTEQNKNHLDMIHYSVHRLDAYIKHILNYTQNAKSEITIEAIDFTQLVSEIRESLKHTKGTERMKIKVKINQSIPFHSDRMRISIILNNLFSNAIKYQDHTKNDSYIAVDIITSETEAKITIMDNGIGIDKKHLNKIFKMFYRVSNAATGSGLGLYIVKEAVHKVGGEVNVDSVPKEKTVFTILIPNR